MIKVRCEQGSDEWFQAKIGVASSSSFDRIVTASGKPSSQADDYLYELVAEYVTGEKKYIKPSYWMERGTDMEPQARAMYELIQGVIVEQVGFVYRNGQKLIGCSPDGFASSIKGLEIKCPAPLNHISYLLQGVCPKQYLPQVQGSMWITGLEKWDFMSFHPDYDSLIVTIDRDPKWMDALDGILPAFVKRLKSVRQSDRVQDLLKQRLEKAA